MHPAPLQQRIRTWHGSSTSEATVELAAEYGDPIWVANAQKSVEGYLPLVQRYRQAWAEFGRDPEEALVGAGFSVFLARRSQDALAAARVAYDRFFGRVDTFNDFDPAVLFHSFEDWLERGSALVGSPQQALDKLARYHEAYGYSAISIPGHPDQTPRGQWIEQLELLQGEVVPELRKTVAGPRKWGVVATTAEPAVVR